MKNYQAPYLSIYCSTLEDELKADLLFTWFNKFSLVELQSMEETFVSSRETNKIIRALIHPDLPVPADISNIVKEIREKLDAIKVDDEL
jgi:hypothetical protein